MTPFEIALLAISGVEKMIDVIGRLMDIWRKDSEYTPEQESKFQEKLGELRKKWADQIQPDPDN